MTFGTIDQTNSTQWVSRQVKRATSMKMKNSAGLFHIWTQRGHHTAGLSFPAARYQAHLLHYRHTQRLFFCVHNLKGKWTQYNNVSMLITRCLIFFCARVLQEANIPDASLPGAILCKKFYFPIINVDIVDSGVLDLQCCVYQLVLSRWTSCVGIVLLCTNWYYLGGRGGISRPESPYRC